MDAVALAEAADDAGIMDGIDVDPGDRGRLLEDEAFRKVLDVLPLEALFVVVDDRDLRLFGLLLAHVDQAAGRQPGLPGASVSESRHG